MKKEHRRFVKHAAWLGFGLYMIGLVYFLFISEELGRSGRVSSANLVPFQEINRSVWLLKHGLLYHKWSSIRYFIVNFVLNIVAFMPFGFFLPIISSRQKNFFVLFVSASLFTVSIELIQLMFGVGIFDVDDMILNVSGGILGYILYWLTRKTFLGVLFHTKKDGKKHGSRKKEKFQL
ncbi:MAG: VanZ family protein [Clostridiales bacterium]|nr:VanZ family protein [Clostridiales bacterium]